MCWGLRIKFYGRLVPSWRWCSKFWFANAQHVVPRKCIIKSYLSYWFLRRTCRILSWWENSFVPAKNPTDVLWEVVHSLAPTILEVPTSFQVQTGPYGYCLACASGVLNEIGVWAGTWPIMVFIGAVRLSVVTGWFEFLHRVYWQIALKFGRKRRKPRSCVNIMCRCRCKFFPSTWPIISSQILQIIRHMSDQSDASFSKEQLWTLTFLVKWGGQGVISISAQPSCLVPYFCSFFTILYLH